MTFIVSLILMGRCIYYNIIPFEASICFDSKIYELKNKGDAYFDLISIGSSMTLNHLNSDLFVEQLSNKSYYNVSAWGQTISQDYQLLQLLVPKYKPKHIFIVSYPSDFNNREYHSISDVKYYLYTRSHIVELFLMLKHKLQTQFLDEDIEYEFLKTNYHYYDYLGYDEYGGITLDVTHETRSAYRWDEYSSFRFDRNNKGYQDLSNICEYLSSKNIELIFIISPARSHYYDKNLDDVQMHIAYCDSILNKHGHLFINEMNFDVYNDCLFADCSHMNKSGSELFTYNILLKYQLLKYQHN